MEHLYIDESGTMTVSHNKTHPYFIISIIRAKNIDRLKRIYKRFVSSHRDELKKAYERKLMFRGSDFLELKGSCFTPKLKREFVDFFAETNILNCFILLQKTAAYRKSFMKIPQEPLTISCDWHWSITYKITTFRMKGLSSNWMDETKRPK